MYLKEVIPEEFQARGTSVSLKYIDPSYMIRSLPANARDANFCLRLGHAAVHAGMAGKTDIVIGSWRRRLTHLPIPLAVASRKQVDTNGYLWQTVLSVTGQPDDLASNLPFDPSRFGSPVCPEEAGQRCLVGGSMPDVTPTQRQPHVVVLGEGSRGTTETPGHEVHGAGF